MSIHVSYFFIKKVVVKTTFKAGFCIFINGIGISDEPTPLVTKLFGNYPIPFNPETTIRFSLEKWAHVTIDIYNVKSERVRRLVNDNLDKGNLYRIWNGSNDANKPQASGFYFYRFVTDGYSATGKMLLLKLEKSILGIYKNRLSQGLISLT